MQGKPSYWTALFVLSTFSVTVSGQADVDLGQIVERHEMIPMRDGNRLSAYLYFPTGSGPWPAVFEQRYADLRGAGTRRAAAKRLVTSVTLRPKRRARSA